MSDKLKLILFGTCFIAMIVFFVLFAITKNGIFLGIGTGFSLWYLGMVALFSHIKQKKEFDGYKSDLRKLKEELRSK